MLISEKTLKSCSLINDNVDAMYIYPSIHFAQNALKEIIGSCLYDKIVEMVFAGEVEEPYKHLLDEYITPYLINKVTSEIQVPIAYKVRNQGVIQVNGENTQSVSMKDVQYLESYYNNKANYYANRLSAYLIDNTSIFPEYKACSCADLNPNPFAYNLGICL